ncbi:hypothetical protein G9A89_003037 [Geosiphon pyriformis]|nr:hypothetical protein G9A89_003037 [Geosiphon pyriformis]
MSYHQYFFRTTRKKERKTKNLFGILTKTRKLIMTKTNQQTGCEKKLIKERKKKTKPFSLVALIVYMLTLYHHHPIIIDQNWNASIAESGITNHVSHVKLSYLTKKYGITFLGVEEHVIRHANELWRMAYVKAEGVTTSELLEIKNNSLSLPKPEYVQTFNVFGNIEDNPEEFHKHYQHLALTREEQEQHLEHDNDEGIMPERVHNTNAGFDLRYSRKNSLKLEPYLHTCIDLKIALEISATTIIQLASRNSLAKKRINIKGGIIDTGYIGNIIAMLQNDSEKAYIIDPNKKIAQTIFLLLVKIAQLVSVKNREELGITARGIQRFGSMGRIDISVNMVEEEIVDKGEIISTCQSIFIPPYDQYRLAIKREVKNQAQLFEAETSILAMDPADKEKTAFTTKEENFEFEIMLFGLMNTPATFQWLMEIVYTGLL